MRLLAVTFLIGGIAAAGYTIDPRPVEPTSGVTTTVEPRLQRMVGRW